MSGVKRQKLEHEPALYSTASNTFCDTYKRHLLDISDDVLLNILSYLPASDLFNLSRTCDRFHMLCQDRTLWAVADFRGCRRRADELHSILQMLKYHTKFLAIRGFADVASRAEAGILPESFLVSLTESCPHLETFIVEDYYIDVDKVDCRAFPRTVKCLSLKACQVVDSAKVRCLSSEKSHFFLQVYVYLPNLEKLVLSYCRWFRLHSLMAISKCANLVELRLDGIRHLHDNVPYLSLATSFGFRKLKILDMRNTTVGSSAMRGFNNLLNLTHLYLECPPQYRKRETNNPVPSTSQHCPESSDEDCEEVNLMRGHENSCVIVLRFGGLPEVWHNKVCANDCCKNGEESRILQVRQNCDQGEGTSKQGDNDGPTDTATRPNENVHTGTNSQEVSAQACVETWENDSGTSNDKPQCENPETEDSNDTAIYVRSTGKSGQSKNTCCQNENEKRGINVGINVEKVSVEAGSSSAEQTSGSNMETFTSSESVDEKSAGCGESSSAQKEHLEDSSKEMTEHKDNSDNTVKMVDKSLKDETLQQKQSRLVEAEPPAGGRDSSDDDDDDSSDDEPNSEGNCRQSASGGKPGKKICSGRLRSVELFSSARNAKSARTSCVGGRHEELIDDLSIDYFLSRDMWRVSLDGNIVRCNDRSPQLHTLVIRFYPQVTDKTLYLLYKISSLRYVDVTGTKVTEKGVEWFRMIRPDVILESDFSPPN